MPLKKYQKVFGINDKFQDKENKTKIVVKNKLSTRKKMCNFIRQFLTTEQL